jgi:hypothetical protein
VKGHQDATSPASSLDIYAKLNIEMDMGAKLFLDTAQRSPRHFYTTNEPWSLWIDRYKITNDLNEVFYDVLHAPVARKYWAKKHEVDEEVFLHVNWPAIKEAASSSTMTK